MPWQNELDSDASRSFAADEQNRSDQRADPDIGKQGCPECPVRLVVVEFAEKPGTKTFFLGARSQYVNLSKKELVEADPAIVSAHQLGQLPPIVVKVSPPQAKTVTLRLVRSESSHGFPGGSEVLSGRESGLAHLKWPVAQSSVTTDGNGEGKLEPGIKVPAHAGFKYHVEGSIDGKPFVRSSNFINIRRRIALREVVRYRDGDATALGGINGIRGDLEKLDIECELLPKLTGAELGIREVTEVDVYGIGEQALDSPASVSVYKPNAIAVVVGKLIPSANGALPAVNFAMDVNRGADGSFPASATMPLQDATSTYTLIPLDSGAHFIASGCSVTPGSGSAQPLNAAEIGGLNTLTESLTIDLTRFRSQPAAVTALRIRLSLKAINGYHVGWAHPSHPVIYLNLLSPFTKTLLTSTKAAALMIHELGHKLHLASPGGGTLPDKQAHHYPTMTTAPHHQGPHCSTGVPLGDDLTTSAAHAAATCTMWGALKETKDFCPECQTSLRKVDLSAGF